MSRTHERVICLDDIDLGFGVAAPATPRTPTPPSDIRDTDAATIGQMTDEQLDSFMDQWQAADDLEEATAQAAADTDQLIAKYGLPVGQSRDALMSDRLAEIQASAAHSANLVTLHKNAMAITAREHESTREAIRNIEFQQAPSTADKIADFVKRHPIISGFLGTDLLYRLHK